MPDETLLRPLSMTAHPNNMVRYLAFGTQMRATIVDMQPRAHVSVLPVVGVTLAYVPSMTMPGMMRQAARDMAEYLIQLADQMEEEMTGIIVEVTGDSAAA